MKSTSIKNIWGRALPVTVAIMAAMILSAALAISLSPGLARFADAAVTNYPPGVAVHAMPISIAATYTTDTTPVRFKLPYAGRLIGFSAAARTVSGTAITVDFRAAGTSLLSGTVSLLSDGVVVDGTITTSAVADEAELTVVIGTGGGAGDPSVTDITVLPTFLRR